MSKTNYIDKYLNAPHLVKCSTPTRTSPHQDYTVITVHQPEYHRNKLKSKMSKNQYTNLYLNAHH